jgi:hypothetical protein
MTKISEHEQLDLSELSQRLGEIRTDDLESTQNALMILIQFIREQAQKIKILKAEIEYLEAMGKLAAQVKTLADVRTPYPRLHME